MSVLEFTALPRRRHLRSAPYTAMLTRTIEILFTERCPYVAVAIERVRTAARLRGKDLDIQIKLVQVESLADAARRKFVGSPTVRIDGKDVDRATGKSASYGLHGRAYSVDGLADRAPAIAWITRGLSAQT